MKYTRRDLSRLAAGWPDGLRAVLVYGPDAGHVGETAEEIARGVVDDLSDPFRATELAAGTLRDDPAALLDAAAALSLTGGSRLVRARGATDALAPRFADLAAAPAVEAATVVEAGPLNPRSALRVLFERASNMAALACYGDSGEGLEAFARRTLEELGARPDREAVAFLAERLGGDRRMTRSELEKLATMAGPGGAIGVADAALAIGDSGALALDDIAFAAAGGDAAGLERGLARAWADGEAPVRVLRAAAGHFQRLHRTAVETAAGAALPDAMKALRPPVFFARRNAFAAQARAWTPPRLEAGLARLAEAERLCKSTGRPDRAVCGQTLIGLCLSASRRRR